jgi:glycerol-3-phosphate dehydrogenase
LIRDLARLAGSEFDVLVVGGGIYGLTIAYDAAQRGLNVGLVERGDFGAATSFNHLKTIHGGLRYLQSADFNRMRESIRERRSFARIAPRFVIPQTFAIPTGSALTRSRAAFRAALFVDSLVGYDRNDAVREGRRLPAGRMAGRQESRRLFDWALPSVDSAAVWHDYAIQSDRLTLAFAKAAAGHGAQLANYVEAVEPLQRAGRLTGVKARDRESGDSFDIQGRLLINAAGPWAASLLDRAAVKNQWPLIKAMNIVTSRPAQPVALAAPTRGGRSLVLLPWKGYTLAGTSESRNERRADDQEVRQAELDRFVAEINSTFPALELRTNEVTLVHRGIVPATVKADGISLMPHSRIIDHAEAGRPELMSVVGVKYTTARAVAERVVDLALRKLGRIPVRCRTAETLLPEAGIEEGDPVDPVACAVRDEMARTLSDVLIRRLGFGAVGYPGDERARQVADRMQIELHWSNAQKDAELDDLRRFYAILSGP